MLLLCYRAAVARFHSPIAGSRTKKLLERLKSKGVIRTQMGLAGIVYVINAGQ